MMADELRSLRVLWLSKWNRPLARIYAESLIDAGAEVMLVTSDLHPESDTARRYEVGSRPEAKDTAQLVGVRQHRRANAPVRPKCRRRRIRSRSALDDVQG